MNNLKFRIWDKAQNCYIKDLENYTLNCLGQLLIDYGDSYELIDNQDNYVVEYCLDTKDKNGNDIYTNDIVVRRGGFTYKILKVEWDGNGYNIPKDKLYYDGSELIKILFTYEVLGNIHENPELLESEDD